MKQKGKLYTGTVIDDNNNKCIILCTETTNNDVFSGVVIESTIEPYRIGEHDINWNSSLFTETIGQIDLNNIHHITEEQYRNKLSKTIAEQTKSF